MLNAVRGAVNASLVNGSVFGFLHAEKCVIFRVFARKCAIQKVR